MTGKDDSKYTLKRSEKVKTLPAKASIKLSGKGEAFFFLTYYVKVQLLWQTVVILDLTIVKDMNCEYISQRCSNQQFKCKKQKIQL